MGKESGAESEKKPSELVWRLWREDTYGNQFLIPLPEEATTEDVIEAYHVYNAKGHQQIYYVKPMKPTNKTSFVAGSERLSREPDVSDF